MKISMSLLLNLVVVFSMVLIGWPASAGVSTDISAIEELGAATTTKTVDLPSVQAAGVEGPIVSELVVPKISPSVRDLQIGIPMGEPSEINPLRNFFGSGALEGTDTSKLDPLATKGSNQDRTPTPLIDFEGMGDFGLYTPPDPTGDVGPHHYVQMVNVFFSIFDKAGTLLVGPVANNLLWSGYGGPCENDNTGDPIVLYDDMADRWMLSQFAVSTGQHMCLAISQTPDPLGAYWLYGFTMPDFPDYPKLGIWPDAYYLGTNTGFPNQYYAHALDRVSMLAGLPAAMQSFKGYANFLMPADADGQVPPPTGSPGFFYTNYSAGYPDHPPGVDRLAIYEFDVDWTNPTNSTFTLTTEIPIAPYNYTVCGIFVGDCIPQPGTNQNLDDLSWWPMVRLQYRNFGTYEAMVSNFTVDLDGTDKAAIRWFELRKLGENPWALYQEGTHAPDGDHRWMGSIAMDAVGNIALGYSVSSETTNPAIRYATRDVTDPLGTLQSEVSLIEGGGVNSGPFDRWGDYSSMTVDPIDQCTFWYTNEYHNVPESSFMWNTRIGAFKMPSCPPMEPEPGCHRILFDETHGVYTSYTIGGLYSEIAAFLESYGHTVDSLQTGPFDYITISQYDVLVLMLPQTPYTTAEKNAIIQFVEEGRRLVTIGENGNPDFDNSRAILNNIHAHLGDGLVHNADHVYDPTHYVSNPNWPLIHEFSPDTVNNGIGTVLHLAASSLDVSEPAYGTGFGDDDTYTSATAMMEWVDGTSDPTRAPYTPKAPEGTTDTTNMSDIPHVGGSGTFAPGAVIEVFSNTWAISTLGFVYDPATDFVRYAHESVPNPTVYNVDRPIPHTVLGSISLSAVNPGWPPVLDNRTGVGYDSVLVTYLLPDFNGDGDVTADDNIVEIDMVGNILNAWETDGAGNDSYDGSFIDAIVDIAVVPGEPTRYFATSGADGSLVYEIDLIKSGWFIPGTWGTLNTCAVPGLIENIGIDYDAQNEVLYHSDWSSTNIVVTDLACNVLDTFTCESPAGFNTGVTFIEGSWPSEVWVTDYSSNVTTRCEAVGAPPNPVIVQAMSNVGLGDVFAIGDVNLWTNSNHNSFDNNQLAWNVFAFGQVCEEQIGDINGYIDLQGRGDDSNAEVCAWDGNILEGCTTTAPDGYYELSLDAGLYDIDVEMERYLDTENTGVSVTVGITTTLNTVVLPGGDTNDDDTINILDLAFMGARYLCSLGDPCFDPRADINNDGTINIQDLAITGSNYLEVSPVPWP